MKPEANQKNEPNIFRDKVQDPENPKLDSAKNAMNPGPQTKSPASNGRKPSPKKPMPKAPRSDKKAGLGSKGNTGGNPKVIQKDLKRIQKEKSPQLKGKVKDKPEAWKIDYYKGAKIYKLTAFTTVDSIEKKFRLYRRQAIIRKILVTLILIFLLFIVIGKLINFSDTNIVDYFKG